MCVSDDNFVMINFPCFDRWFCKFQFGISLKEGKGHNANRQSDRSSRTLWNNLPSHKSRRPKKTGVCVFIFAYLFHFCRANFIVLMSMPLTYFKLWFFVFYIFSIYTFSLFLFPFYLMRLHVCFRRQFCHDLFSLALTDDFANSNLVFLSKKEKAITPTGKATDPPVLCETICRPTNPDDRKKLGYVCLFLLIYSIFAVLTLLCCCFVIIFYSAKNTASRSVRLAGRRCVKDIVVIFFI